ncbi:MAG TPA: BsuPI-related putative proteinase inhibitor [Chthonomonadaceae bacterium]|nr:BsuPI-related putative proteinase inhibitor [Chthonomonadaceae bacterium]
MQLYHTRRRFLAGMVGLLVIGVVVPLALAQTPPRPNDPKPSGKPEPPLKAEVKTNKQTYGVNDPIQMTFTVKNTGGSTLPLNFSSSQKYDFEIKRGKDATGETIWKWSKGRAFAMVMLSSKLEPGKPLTFTEWYKPGAKSAEGAPLPALTAGAYTTVATLTTTGSTPKPSAKTTFQVK